MEAKNKIPHKKLTASGTNRFDKDTYCKRKLTKNTLTFLQDIIVQLNEVSLRAVKFFPTGFLKDNEKRSASARHRKDKQRNKPQEAGHRQKDP